MLEENKESKNAEELTPAQPAPTEEKKDQETSAVQPEGTEEENVTLSKKELENLKKRAADYDRSIELKRLNKLGKKEETTKTDEELNAKVQELDNKLSSLQSQSFNSGLTEAYRSFVTENPWANDDAKFDKIKENFVTVGTETKEELLVKFKSAAQIAYPTEYEQHLTDKIKAKVMSEKLPTPDGGAASSATTIHKDEKPKTEEELRAERLGSLLRKNITWLPKKQ